MSLLRKSTPEPPAVEQGAPVTTVELRNPQALIAELDAEATKSEAAADQDAKSAARLRADAEEHARKAGEFAGEEMRLMEELTKAREARELHERMRGGALGEAKKYAERAKQLSDRAADLRATIAVVQQQAPRNGNGQAPVDPTAETRMDESLARIDAAHAELQEKHRDGGDL
jgi:DNA repair exonuclease SbcCD ATPase subunit